MNPARSMKISPGSIVKGRDVYRPDVAEIRLVILLKS